MKKAIEAALALVAEIKTAKENQTIISDNRDPVDTSSTSICADHHLLPWLDDLEFSALADPFHFDWPYW